jgi:hypothetical protein
MTPNISTCVLEILDFKREPTVLKIIFPLTKVKMKSIKDVITKLLVRLGSWE